MLYDVFGVRTPLMLCAFVGAMITIYVCVCVRREDEFGARNYRQIQLLHIRVVTR